MRFSLTPRVRLPDINPIEKPTASVDRQTIGRLHHTEHVLAGNQAFFGHAVLPHAAHLLAQACGADGGQVIKNQGHVLIHLRLEQTGHQEIHGRLVVHQSVHAAQQVLMGQSICVDAGHTDRLQLTQHSPT